MAGMIKDFQVNTDGTTLTQEQYDAMWTAGNNQTFAENADIKLTNAWNWGNVNPMPQSGSPVLTGASFSGLSGFETVAFIGGFGTTNWTSGWCSWDPQNARY